MFSLRYGRSLPSLRTGAVFALRRRDSHCSVAHPLLSVATGPWLCGVAPELNRAEHGQLICPVPDHSPEFVRTKTGSIIIKTGSNLRTGSGIDHRAGHCKLVETDQSFNMNAEMAPSKARLLPVLVLFAALLIWSALSLLKIFPESVFPSPLAVARGFVEEVRSGRLVDDLVASLFRVTTGFALAVFSGVPIGLWLGQRALARSAFLPLINFFRSLSPLAWIPFAILWFGIGDLPAIFLIFMTAFFPVVLATCAAVANITSIYFRVAHDYGFSNNEILTRVTLPAIAPQVITSLRVTAGLAWLVVVAAEMIAGRAGLGFAIWDARNGLRMDLLVGGMIVIGVIGMVIDRVLVRLTKIDSVRWG